MNYAFDIEIFKNFLSVIFINPEDGFDEYTFIIFEDRDDSEKIKEFIQRPVVLGGYNNLHFDNVILNALLEGYSCEQLYELGQDIIKPKNEDLLFSLRTKNVLYKSIDFKELIGLDIGLKQVTVCLEWPKVQDLPLPYDSIITPKEVPLILEYNRNDVLPLVKLWNDLQPDLQLRARVNELYGVNVSSKSEGQLPNVIFESLYSQASKSSIKKIKEGRTHRETIFLHQCIGRNIELKDPQLKDFLDSVKDLDLIKGFREKVCFGNMTFNLGVGGLHTQDNPGYFYADKENLIIDADVTSFYPNIMLLNSIKPAHLSEKFLDIFKSMVKERVQAKAEGDKIKADILKISINAVFGKLRNENYWLYDPLAFYSVTISGQLYLLSLAERLILDGFEVISANTDGIISRVPRQREQGYYRVCKEWETQTHFSLEYSLYSRYIRRDVNNYIAKSTKGKVKRKGIFELKEDVALYKRLQKSYSPEIIPQALTNYFIEDIPVEETLEKSRNIWDFLMSQRVHKKFKTIFRNGTDEILQYTNRYYAALEGGIILKQAYDDKKNQTKEISILADIPVQIANNIDPKRPFKDYGVNLSYYQDEAIKVISLIEPKVEQLYLF